MARLTVPDVFKPALAKLSLLSDTSAAELLSAITSSIPILNPKTMASKIGPLTPSIEPQDLNSILGALFALSAVRVTNKVPISEFLDDLCESLRSKMKDAGAAGVAALKSRLRQLLQAEPLVLAAKASAIQREYPSVLVNARILTDMRPVFGDVPDSPQAAVIVHNLKVTYFQSNEPREFFFALDDDDLAMLQKTIVRAEAKSRVLRALIEKAGLPNIDPSQG